MICNHEMGHSHNYLTGEYCPAWMGVSEGIIETIPTLLSSFSDVSLQQAPVWTTGQVQTGEPHDQAALSPQAIVDESERPHSLNQHANSHQYNPQDLRSSLSIGYQQLVHDSPHSYPVTRTNNLLTPAEHRTFHPFSNSPLDDRGCSHSIQSSGALSAQDYIQTAPGSLSPTSLTGCTPGLSSSLPDQSLVQYDRPNVGFTDMQPSVSSGGIYLSSPLDGNLLDSRMTSNAWSTFASMVGPVRSQARSGNRHAGATPYPIPLSAPSHTEGRHRATSVLSHRYPHSAMNGSMQTYQEPFTYDIDGSSSPNSLPHYG
jgi:hypothetical protein